MDRFAALARLLSLCLLLLAVASACSSNCEDNPEEGEYCEAQVTGL
ncbi:MAG: hypothetical protein AB7T31_11050 [Gemmatimonadales bacterium]